jgi:hypothetical protein
VDHQKIRGEIIDFILESPDEVNSEVAVFIAGMQARKDLTDRPRKTDNCRYMANSDALIGVKIGLVNK